jgi:hypothetical protein
MLCLESHFLGTPLARAGLNPGARSTIARADLPCDPQVTATTPVQAPDDVSNQGAGTIQVSRDLRIHAPVSHRADTGVQLASTFEDRDVEVGAR